MLRSTSLRVLRPRTSPTSSRSCSATRSPTCFVASRVEAVGLDPARLGGEMWGYSVDGRLEALCHAGANLVPVQAGSDAVRAFAERGRRQGRRCASIVGDRAAVGELWRELASSWGPAREVRDPQPLMAIERAGRHPGRPAGTPGAAGRAGHPAAGLRRDVHRGGRGLPGRAGRRCVLPQPGRRAGARRPRLRPDRGRPGGVQGGDRRRSARPPARCRAYGCRPTCAAAACRRRGWRPWPRSPAARSPPSSACT